METWREELRVVTILIWKETIEPTEASRIARTGLSGFIIFSRKALLGRKALAAAGSFGWWIAFVSMNRQEPR